jgi:hypothetical protein
MKLVKLYLICAAMFVTASALAQYRTFIPMDYGGIPEDIQLVYREDQQAQNVVWSACMNNGFYRTTRNGNTFDTWTEYLPGKAGFGVEAISVGTSSSVEHVILCSAGQGLFYGSSSTGQFSSWDRPGGAQDYPRDWKEACHTDAAFWLPATGSYPSSPIDKFYMILGGKIKVDNHDFYPGIYRWTGTGTYKYSTTRLDAPSADSDYTYSPFYRGLENPNVLYVIRRTKEGQNGWSVKTGEIYKLSGPYGNEAFEPLPPGTKLEDLPIAKLPKNLPVIK